VFAVVRIDTDQFFWDRVRATTTHTFKVYKWATENARHGNAVPNGRGRKSEKCEYVGLRKKIFIRLTALFVFHIAKPFITIKTKC